VENFHLEVTSYYGRQKEGMEIASEISKLLQEAIPLTAQASLIKASHTAIPNSKGQRTQSHHVSKRQENSNICEILYLHALLINISNSLLLLKKPRKAMRLT
jgi:hypothetical protein